MRSLLCLLLRLLLVRFAVWLYFIVPVFRAFCNASVPLFLVVLRSSLSCVYVPGHTSFFRSAKMQPPRKGGSTGANRDMTRGDSRTGFELGLGFRV